MRFGVVVVYLHVALLLFAFGVLDFDLVVVVCLGFAGCD